MLRSTPQYERVAIPSQQSFTLELTDQPAKIRWSNREEFRDFPLLEWNVDAYLARNLTVQRDAAVKSVEELKETLACRERPKVGDAAGLDVKLLALHLVEPPRDFW